MPIEWIVTPVDGWMPSYSAWTNQLIRAVEEAMKARESEITQWMVDNAPWQDRTGLARRTLDTKVFRDGLFIYVLMYHGRETRHSWWLEGHMWKGDPWRFSILAPALDYFAPIILDDVRKILE